MLRFIHALCYQKCGRPVIFSDVTSNDYCTQYNGQLTSNICFSWRKYPFLNTLKIFQNLNLYTSGNYPLFNKQQLWTWNIDLLGHGTSTYWGSNHTVLQVKVSSYMHIPINFVPLSTLMATSFDIIGHIVKKLQQISS